MRWDSFFDDLESRFQAQEAEQLREEIAEGVRVELASEQLSDRLVRLQGSSITLKLSGGVELTARMGPSGKDYFCLEAEGTRWVIRDVALRTVTVAGPRVFGSGRISPVKFSAVIRGTLRDRQLVQIYDLSGEVLAEGTLVQVARDFLVVATHPRDEFAREREITGRLLIPLHALGWIQITDS